MADDDTTLRPLAGSTPDTEGLQPFVEVVVGGRQGERIALRVGAIVVGKGEEADLRMSESGVSRTHARVELSAQGEVTVTDLGSTNGTFVAGRQVQHAVIRAGERIQLGPDACIRLLLLEKGSPLRAPTLSPRQLQLARLVAIGMSNGEIAERLKISPRTVTSHLDHIYTQLDIRTRTALARWVLDRGLD